MLWVYGHLNNLATKVDPRALRVNNLTFASPTIPPRWFDVEPASMGETSQVCCSRSFQGEPWWPWPINQTRHQEVVIAWFPFQEVWRICRLHLQWHCLNHDNQYRVVFWSRSDVVRNDAFIVLYRTHSLLLWTNVGPTRMFNLHSMQ